MILWKFKERTIVPEDKSNWRSKRWTFQVNKWSFGLVLQFKNKDNPKWRDSHTAVFEVSFNLPLAFGSRHFYYAGPHCSFSLGFIHFIYGGNFFTGYCEKCWKDL